MFTRIWLEIRDTVRFYWKYNGAKVIETIFVFSWILLLSAAVVFGLMLVSQWLFGGPCGL